MGGGAGEEEADPMRAYRGRWTAAEYLQFGA